MPTQEQIRRLYAAASDDEVQQALAAGQGSYTPDAWSIITAEGTRRGLAPGPVVEPPDAQASFVRSAKAQALRLRPDAYPVELGPTAAEGRKQLLAIIVVALLACTLSVVYAAFLASAPGLIRAALSLAATAALSAMMLQGRTWARWAMVALAGYASLSVVLAILAFGTANRVLSTMLATNAVAFGTIAVVLTFSRSVHAFFHEVGASTHEVHGVALDD